MLVVVLKSSDIVMSVNSMMLSDHLSTFNRFMIGLADAVMLCGVSRPCHLLTLNIGDERFLTDEETFYICDNVWSKVKVFINQQETKYTKQLTLTLTLKT